MRILTAATYVQSGADCGVGERLQPEQVSTVTVSLRVDRWAGEQYPKYPNLPMSRATSQYNQ